jgi:hypothetical protein
VRGRPSGRSDSQGVENRAVANRGESLWAICGNVWRRENLDPTEIVS